MLLDSTASRRIEEACRQINAKLLLIVPSLEYDRDEKNLKLGVSKQLHDEDLVDGYAFLFEGAETIQKVKKFNRKCVNFL